MYSYVSWDAQDSATDPEYLANCFVDVRGGQLTASRQLVPNEASSSPDLSARGMQARIWL